jgi:RNA polymerase sporulation-specific sigma factor
LKKINVDVNKKDITQVLDEILKKLDARERQLIYMRYFKDMTQTEIAVEMGISQVQVSRMEKRILKQLKDQT